MFGIVHKKHIIYFQSILFLLGSFTLLLQNVMDSSGHLLSEHVHGSGMEHMSMQMEISAGPAQLNHGKAGDNEQCCDNCNCIDRNCGIDCSMFDFMAATINRVGDILVCSSKPAISVPLLVGIHNFPERPPPELFLI